MSKKKPVVFFSIADNKNLQYYEKLEASFKKFHPDIPLKLFSQDDLIPLLKDDPNFFYRSTSFFARELIKEYELVVKIDADSIVTGKLDYVLNSEYDVATVLNWNPQDVQIFGEFSVATIHPQIYFNAGFVAMRSAEFVENWHQLNHSHHFDRMPMREQGLLNVITHYGKYDVRCLDYDDELTGTREWFGLVSKSEWLRSEIKKESIVVPPREGYNKEEKTIKVLHFAEGDRPNKMDYQKRFPEPVIEFIDELVK